MGEPAPFTESLQLETGVVSGAAVKRRHLSDMAEAYEDADAAREMVDAGDPLVYEVHEVQVPLKGGQLLSSTTILKPGTVGGEYFMTKGHFHRNERAAEIYLGLRGTGAVLVRTRQGDVEQLPLSPGQIAYIPPGWAHRTVNTGDDELAFYAVFPADAGYDYETIEREGFGRRLRTT